MSDTWLTVAQTCLEMTYQRPYLLRKVRTCLQDIRIGNNSVADQSLTTSHLSIVQLSTDVMSGDTGCRDASKGCSSRHQQTPPYSTGRVFAQHRARGTDFSFFFLGQRINSLPPLPSPHHSSFRSRPPKYSQEVWGSAVSSPSEVWGKAPADKRFGAYLSQKEELWWQQFLWIFLRINVIFCTKQHDTRGKGKEEKGFPESTNSFIHFRHMLIQNFFLNYPLLSRPLKPSQQGRC